MIQVDDIVKTKYNSGTYIGKVIEDRRNFFLVEIHAVVEHPTQGDLHNPGQTEGIAFPERKALAHLEKCNARKRDTVLYDGVVPTYVESLKHAYTTLKQKLEKEETEFNRLSLERLASLKEHFYEKIFNEES